LNNVYSAENPASSMEKLSDKINSVACASGWNYILEYFDYDQDARYVREENERVKL
jgi:hypothetical protein